jgi:hypothetical protein
MTAIVADKFKDRLYVFADGRVMGDDYFILTESDQKIQRVDEDTLVTMCGDSIIIDPVVSLLIENKLDYITVQSVVGEGEVIILDSVGLRIVNIDNKNTAIHNKAKKGDELDKLLDGGQNGISSYKHDSLPMFFGSGKYSVSGAYYALEVHKSKDEKEYLSRMKKAFKSSSKLLTSIGDLKQVEHIQLKLNKKA